MPAPVASSSWLRCRRTRHSRSSLPTFDSGIVTNVSSPRAHNHYVGGITRARIGPAQRPLCTTSPVIHRKVTGLSTSCPQACCWTLHRMHVPVESEPIGTDPETSWQDDGACLRYAGVVDFFPARGESADAAKAICASCAVRPQCLD